MKKSKLKYNCELMKSKIRLEKELAMVKEEIKYNQANCEHIGAVLVTSGYVQEAYCILCRKKLSNKSVLKKIDATNYKKDTYNNFYKEERLSKLREVQEIAISCLEEEKDLSDEELVKRIQLKIDNNK